MTGPRILFICNAGAAVGGGHVMRSLTLARALAALGARCAFLAPPEVAAILDAYGPDMPRVPAASCRAEALVQAAAGVPAEAVVFDHYGLGAAEHRAVAGDRPSLAIDDLADRPLGADLVLDSGPTREAEDYAGLLPDGARLLLGPQNAPIRPAFAERRDEALGRRGGAAKRVLVSMGLTDVGGVTLTVVRRLAPLLGDLAADVVVGAAAPSLPALRTLAAADPRLTIHVDTPAMADLAARADLAVGAAGSSTWERCVLGLPSLLVVLAENQREAAQAMGDMGAALVVDAAAPDFPEAFDAALSQLIGQPALRAALSAWSAEICDGRGAERVAAAVMQLIAARDGAPQSDSGALN